jgi:hypothetical protein
MVRQSDQEGTRLLSNVIGPGNCGIHAPNQTAYALESDAAEPNQESAIGEKLQRYFKRPFSKALEDLSTSSTANDLERASAFRVAPPK